MALKVVATSDFEGDKSKLTMYQTYQGGRWRWMLTKHEIRNLEWFLEG